MATPIIGTGATLKISGGGTAVALALNISHSGLATELQDVTALDNTTGYRDFLPALIDAGEFTVELLFDPDNAEQVAYDTDQAAGTSRIYVLTLTDTSPSTYTFTAWVTNRSVAVPVGELVTSTVTLKVDGSVAPVWA